MNTSRHHRPILLTLLLVLLLLLVPRPAGAAPAADDSFEQRCERDMHATIEVRTNPPGFVVRNGVSSRVLNTRGTYTLSGEAMMGMTSSNTRADLLIGGPSLVDPAGGRECVAPRIDVELSYQPLEVYVAREFHPASCSYREVYAHEMQHVKVYADSLPRIEQRVRDELLQRYGGRPVYGPLGKGVATLHRQIETWLRPLIVSELALVEVRQRALDSRAETERLSHMCQGEIAQLMGSSF